MAMERTGRLYQLTPSSRFNPGETVDQTVQFFRRAADQADQDRHHKASGHAMMAIQKFCAIEEGNS